MELLVVVCGESRFQPEQTRFESEKVDRMRLNKGLLSLFSFEFHLSLTLVLIVLISTKYTLLQIYPALDDIFCFMKNGHMANTWWFLRDKEGKPVNHRHLCKSNPIWEFNVGYQTIILSWYINFMFKVPISVLVIIIKKKKLSFRT